MLVLLQEVKAFNMMLGRLLNAGYISQARELAALFEHDSPDMTIVLVRNTRVTCYLPHSIPPRQWVVLYRVLNENLISKINIM